MDELIRQIISIEDRAQEIMRTAREADSSLEARVKRDSVRLKNNIENQTNEKNTSLKQMEEAEAAKKISAINEQTQKTMELLEEKYNLNKDKWISEIVNGVIGA